MSVPASLILLRKGIQLEEEEQAERYRLDQQHSLKQLKAEGIALHPITVTRKRFGYAEYPEISFRLPFPQETSLFRDGMAIACFKQGEEEVKGMLMQLDGKAGEFRLYAPDHPEWIEDEGVGIKLAPDTRTTTIMKQALGRVESDKRLAALFQQFHEPGEKKATASSAPLEYFNQHLNTSQQEAVNAMLSGQPCTVVHGPPGTGKTTTLIEGIRQLVKSAKKVVVSAPSNTAVDHISLGLIAAGIRVLRTGNTGKVHKDVFPHTPEGVFSGGKVQKEIKALRIRAEEFRKMANRYVRSFGKAEREQRNLLINEVKQLRTEIKKIQAYEEEKLFRDAQVICGTPIGLYDSIPTSIKPDMLVIDEAGQCLEPLAWCIFPLAETYILAGDHFQLPPTVLSQEAIALGYSRSILEVAIDAGEPAVLLDTQYRMRPSIAGFSSNYFYEGKLRSAEHLTDEGIHIHFIDTAGTGYAETHGPGGTSLQNEGELSVITHLLEHELAGTQPVIISPYAGQVAALKDKFGQSHTIHTIDSYQGQESGVIIISLVRSNDEGIIGFLKDYRRMNVAMTRAKRELYIIGDSATLGNDAFYSTLLDYITNEGLYRSAWEFMEG